MHFSGTTVLAVFQGKVLLNWKLDMTLDELEREYVTLRQQADAVRSYL